MQRYSPKQKERARRTEENLDASSYASSLSTRRTLFRVHKGILAKHSPVFEGMFTLPDPAESTNAARSRVGFGYDAHGHLNKEYEGAPVVELSDTMEQVEQLLGVLYDPLYVPFLRVPLLTTTRMQVNIIFQVRLRLGTETVTCPSWFSLSWR